MSVPEECFNYKIFGLEQSALRETAFENIFCSTGRRDASKSQGFNLNAPLIFFSVANLSFTGKKLWHTTATGVLATPLLHTSPL